MICNGMLLISAIADAASGNAGAVASRAASSSCGINSWRGPGASLAVGKSVVSSTRLWYGRSILESRAIVCVCTEYTKPFLEVGKVVPAVFSGRLLSPLVAAFELTGRAFAGQ